MGHGWLAGNSPEIAWAWQKVTKPIFHVQLVFETWLTSQVTERLNLVGIFQQIIPFRQPKAPQNDFFFNFGGTYVVNF